MFHDTTNFTLRDSVSVQEHVPHCSNSVGMREQLVSELEVSSRSSFSVFLDGTSDGDGILYWGCHQLTNFKMREKVESECGKCF